MDRRTYLASATSVTALSLFAGCTGSNNGSNGDSKNEKSTSTTSNTATDSETDTDTGSESGSESETTTDGGLPSAPPVKTPGTPAAKFTPSKVTTPMGVDSFMKLLEARLDKKDLSTAYVVYTYPDEHRVKLVYVADESTQRDALEAFAESFVEVVARTGGTGGWSLYMVVQTGASRQIWYTWTVRDEWAIQRLSGEISREEFYNKIEKSVTTSTPTSST